MHLTFQECATQPVAYFLTTCFVFLKAVTIDKKLCIYLDNSNCSNKASTQANFKYIHALKFSKD